MTAWTYRYRARITHVRDADSFVAEADLGLRVTHELVVRLAGCDAPEKTTVEGQTAITWVNKWLGLNQDADGWYAITTSRNPGDRYGRWLAQVENVAGTRNLTADLIAAGHAVEWDGRGGKPEPSPDLPTAA